MPKKSLKTQDINSIAQRAQQIYQWLKEAYPAASTALHFKNPRELLIATILSAQCTDKRVNQVTPGLFKKYPTAQAFAEADIEELKNDIRSTGFFNNKAQAIQAAMRTVVTRFGGEIPHTMEELLQLEGVGRKTANVVLGNAFGIPGIVVDTHVKRLANLLGLSRQNDPEKIEQDLAQIFPSKQWTELSNMLIAHGRTVCIARHPQCSQCCLSGLCPAAQK